MIQVANAPCSWGVLEFDLAAIYFIMEPLGTQLCPFLKFGFTDQVAIVKANVLRS
jgi:hypothetical protein